MIFTAGRHPRLIAWLFALALTLVFAFASPGLARKITVPDSSAREIIDQKPDHGVKGLKAAAKAQDSGKRLQVGLQPEVRPPVEAVTPSASPNDPAGRDPKTYDRTSPGLTATLRSGSNTEILGVFSLPGSPGGSVRPYGQPDNTGTPAPSGGVMLKRSF